MERELYSLDRHFHCTAEYLAVDRYRHLLTLPPGASYIAQGAGVSYVPASFGTGSKVINLKAFDRILAFDAEARTVTVEAGASIGKLYDFLLPYGLAVPVQPGHPSITVGGCIAFDVFGKNQTKEGLFDSCVEELELFHPAHGTLKVSRTENSELFELTCGGFGLTGIVVSAKLRLKPIPGPWVNVEHLPAKSIAETFDLLRKYRNSADMLYSWNDLNGRKRGRGFVVVGRFEPGETKHLPPANFPHNLTPPSKRMPAAWNGLTVPLLNRAYYFANVKLRPRQRVAFGAFSYPVANKTFYYRLFGAKGFWEQQLLVPRETETAYLEAFDRCLARHRVPVALTSCKIFTGKQSYLRFGGEGAVLSIDVPRTAAAERFFMELDELNVGHGVRGNLAKDSRLPLSVVRRQYPEYERFRARLRELDPQRTFRSQLSERLEL
jgi:decaprenylphospho-beta-D-ribofuranose 2-oxidase